MAKHDAKHRQFMAIHAEAVKAVKNGDLRGFREALARGREIIQWRRERIRRMKTNIEADGVVLGLIERDKRTDDSSLT